MTEADTNDQISINGETFNKKIHNRRLVMSVTQF